MSLLGVISTIIPTIQTVHVIALQSLCCNELELNWWFVWIQKWQEIKEYPLNAHSRSISYSCRTTKQLPKKINCRWFQKWVPKISNVDDAFFFFEEPDFEEGVWFSQVIMHPVTAWESHWQEPPGSWYFLYCLFDYVYGNDDDDRAPLPSHTITWTTNGDSSRRLFLLQTLAPGDDRNGQGSTHVVVICIFYFFFCFNSWLDYLYKNHDDEWPSWPPHERRARDKAGERDNRRGKHDSSRFPLYQGGNP